MVWPSTLLGTALLVSMQARFCWAFTRDQQGRHGRADGGIERPTPSAETCPSPSLVRSCPLLQAWDASKQATPAADQILLADQQEGARSPVEGQASSSMPADPQREERPNEGHEAHRR